MNVIEKMLVFIGNYLKSLPHIILTATIHPNISKIVTTVHAVLKNIDSIDMSVL
jgi:ABC-type methionine transport system permease subunit